MHIRISRIYCIILCITNTDQEIRIMDSKGGKGGLKCISPQVKSARLLRWSREAKRGIRPRAKSLIDRGFRGKTTRPTLNVSISIETRKKIPASSENFLVKIGPSMAPRSRSDRCDVERSWEGMKEGEERERERRDGRRSTSLQGWSTRFTRDGSIARPRVLDPPQTDSLCRRLDSMRRVLNVKRSPRSRNAANRIPPRSAKKKKRWYNVTGPKCVSVQGLEKNFSSRIWEMMFEIVIYCTLFNRVK